MVNTLKTTDKANSYYPYISSICAARMQMKDEKKPTPVVQGNTPGAEKKDELELTDLNGKTFSLNDLKGKVVYIDFWASWCGPCRQMMPYSKQLHDNLTESQKKQILFLYISIDANEEAWKKAITDLGMEGKQGISPGNWNSKACSYFQINSIPRYMIMDKKGNIVDFNAKRPADPALLEELLKFLE
jgi:thiol-disulfide isomerase/thioredoxin